jgi:putative SOS response-associated peptidase YedK
VIGPIPIIAALTEDVLSLSGSTMEPMCGRYSLADLNDTFSSRFKVTNYIHNLTPRYNVAPSQTVPVVVRAEDENQAELMDWGLIPAWSRDGKGFINAKAETVSTKPSFKRAFRVHRCIVPVSSFFEWQRSPEGKFPYLIKLKREKLFGLAGIWEEWQGPYDLPVQSFAIITCPANPLVARIHDRMPVILKQEDEATWLNPALRDPAQLRPLLRPYPASEMEAYRVTLAVNSPSNNSPELLEPILTRALSS